MQARLRAHAAAHQDNSWIIGILWSQHDLGRYPCAADLDGALGTDPRPAFLWRACWHIGVANSAALALLGLADSELPPTPGGKIDTDPASGRPTGVLRERATELVSAFTEERSASVRRRYFEAGLAQCAAAGLTAVQSNDGNT